MYCLLYQIIAFLLFISILQYIVLMNVGSLKSHIRHQTTLQGKEDLSSKYWNCTNGRTCLLLKYSSMIAKSMPLRFLMKRHSREYGASRLYAFHIGQNALVLIGRQVGCNISLRAQLGIGWMIPLKALGNHIS